MGQTGPTGASGSSVPSIPSSPSTPASQITPTNKQQRQKRNNRIAYAVLGGLLCLLLAFLTFLTWSPTSRIIVPPANDACSQMVKKLNNGISQVELPPDTQEYIGVSDGSFIFDRPRADDELKCQGALSYRTKAYNDAGEWWTKSVLPQNLSGLHYESNDAEALIYREDSRIKNAGLPCETFIVGTILTGKYNGIGRDVLQGAYVAQEEFNRSKTATASKIPLQICLLVANFSSAVRNYQQNGGGSIEVKVAQKILDTVDTATSPIKGIIIGLPYTSDATISMLNNNDKHVPVILTGAFSMSQMVRVSNTFPVAASVEREGQYAALYAINTLKAKNITVLVYNDDPYSKYLAQAFEDQIDRSRSSDRIIRNTRTPR
jgi:hypothetical protein